jgi:hypothetical protein
MDDKVLVLWVIVLLVVVGLVERFIKAWEKKVDAEAKARETRDAAKGNGREGI